MVYENPEMCKIRSEVRVRFNGLDDFLTDIIIRAYQAGRKDAVADEAAKLLKDAMNKLMDKEKPE